VVRALVLALAEQFPLGCRQSTTPQSLLGRDRLAPHLPLQFFCWDVNKAAVWKSSNLSPAGVARLPFFRIDCVGCESEHEHPPPLQRMFAFYRYSSVLARWYFENLATAGASKFGTGGALLRYGDPESAFGTYEIESAHCDLLR